MKDVNSPVSTTNIGSRLSNPLPLSPGRVAVPAIRCAVIVAAATARRSNPRSRRQVAAR
jgi:hypothetical protein